jgi:hypothetical protein
MSNIDIQKGEDIQLLLALCDSKFLTETQIHEWFYAGIRKQATTRQRLLRLRDANVLKTKDIPQHGRIKDRKVYLLGPQAAYAIDWKCKELLGIDPPYSVKDVEAARRRAENARKADRIIHEVYISQLRMCLARSSYEIKDWKSESYFREHPLQVEGKRNLIPDAFFYLQFPDGRRRIFFAEIDTYRKNAKEALDKAERYAEYWMSGQFAKSWKWRLGLKGDKPGFVMLNIIPESEKVSTWKKAMSGFGYPQLSFLFYCATQAFIAPEVIEKAIWTNAKGQQVSLSGSPQIRRHSNIIVNSFRQTKS